MLIDLHCHSLPLSHCSSLTPDALVERGRARGLDGICLTEHDRHWNPAELLELRERTGFLILSGVEFTTDRGHILAFGLTPGHPPVPTLAELRKVADAQDALLFLAHPARDGLLRTDHDLVSNIDGVEALNGSDSRLQNIASTGLARPFALPGIGGSDAHSASEVGRAATRFSRDITDNASLVAALRDGMYEAVYLE